MVDTGHGMSGGEWLSAARWYLNAALVARDHGDHLVLCHA